MRAIEQRRAAGDDQPRLFLGADDLERDAGLAFDPGHELGAIGGAAAGFGGDGARAGDVMRGDLLGADFERFDGARHRRFGKPAARGEAFAQADDARERIDDAERRGRRPLGAAPRHQQAAIIGAEIERRIGRFAAARSPVGGKGKRLGQGSNRITKKGNDASPASGR